MVSKLQRAAGLTAFWPRTFLLVWTAAPRWTLAWFALLIMQGLLPIATVYLSKHVVDSLVAAMSGPRTFAALQPVLVLVGLTALVLIVSEFAQGASRWVRTAQSELVQDHLKGLIHRQCASLDLALYDSPEYHDGLEQVRSEAATRPLALLESAGSLVQNGITLIAMAAVLLPYGAWLPLVLLVSTAPAMAVALNFDRQYHRWWQSTTAERRRVQYFDILLTSPSTAAEVRLFNLAECFHAAYQVVRARLRNEHLAHLRQQSLAGLGASMLALVVGGMALAWMVWRAVEGGLTLGDLALFYQAFQRGQGLMRSLLGNLGDLYSNTLFLGNLYGFLDKRPQVCSPLEPVALEGDGHTVRFESVTFRYPGADRPALEDFSLTIPANRVVAVVGANGAGKSTLIKLLCRFYEPENGRITFDGIDTRDLAVDELRRKISVLFQFPVPYQATAAENITFGDVEAESDQAALERAASAAGIHELLAELPKGYQTHLGKWFSDGVELSGGEWQRMAMARAYLRKAPIVLLDEPTSFMDSWAEADWFDRFRGLVAGRTGLIITHRFTIAMRADVIYVMDQGRIVESGTHHELLARGGLYAESWAAQMQATSLPQTSELATETAA